MGTRGGGEVRTLDGRGGHGGTRGHREHGTPWMGHGEEPKRGGHGGTGARGPQILSIFTFPVPKIARFLISEAPPH